ncbi:hypothetical protein BEL04_05095 [Mucilaginibacter sp. PPCGB 2223]|uniref:DUF1624 domain-containing protein n=1 Tax=Mucilaginibacter sp. PPCGB 2223 TaxID=1886027 RepID=UPI000824507F|nr:heparan-alpha-glucosaminide N-acetyltransferase domain-containing protein [Mucilaginibacter sp. PPCGB 2223]OCX53673.1 hypothetical protein BEL04_05095 [Mucilaginibacter sp. PPCGB 2223]
MTDTLTQPKKRIESIDVMRGIVMVIMALDHTRDFFTTIRFNPTDLTQASTALFITRFITHYCAATFVFLAGTGAYLSLTRGKTKAEAARFLISRGIWLVILEVTLINWGFSMNHGTWQFSMDYSFVFLQVIWVIGVSMIILAGLIYLPVEAIGIIGLILIFGHNAFDVVAPKSLGETGGALWQFLHVQGIVNYAHNTRHVFVFYPLIPWVGVMAAGYSFGTLFKMEQAKRQKLLVATGLSAIALFILIRSGNFYGDPDHWTHQQVWYRTVLSFINAQKYPPSLDYLLITLGPVLILLAYLEGVKNRVTDIFLVFGRVPLFYYLCHIYLLQLLAYIAFKITETEHIAYGFGLPIVYAVWLLAVFILYFPSKWFMQYKQAHRQWWLSYL